MDQRRTPTTKTAGNRHSTAPARSGSFQLVHFVLGVVLITAGVLKLYQLAFETENDSPGILLLMVLAEAEIFGGIWMIAGFHSAKTHPWVIAVFAGLASASLFQGIAGKCSCGCFGGLVINPWVVLVFDLVSIAALLAWRPPVDPNMTPLTHPARLPGLVLLAIVIGVAFWRQVDLVTIAGTATLEGHPLQEARLTFTGESGTAVVRTDADGRFRVALAGLGRYAVALSDAPEVPAPTRGPAEKKAAGRVKQRPAMAAPKDSRTLSWIEVSKCTQQNETIEFK